MANLTYLKNVVTLKIFTERCNGCGMCIAVCPHNVFTIDGKKAKILDVDACMECGACVKNCPQEAIFVRSGVGCATKIVMEALRNTSSRCRCSQHSDSCC